MTILRGRGGAGRGQGRKRIKDEEPSVMITLRVTPSQRQKVKALGGAKWIRAKIDQEPLDIDEIKLDNNQKAE